MRRRICFKFSSCKCCSRQGGSQKRWGNTDALTWNFLLKVKLTSRISTAKERARSTNAPSSVWWEKVDSNHRRQCQQIYSLSPLATREFSHIKLELVIGVEPTTCWLQISCSAIEPHQHNRSSQWNRGFSGNFSFPTKFKNASYREISRLTVYIVPQNKRLVKTFFENYKGNLKLLISIPEYG